MACLLTISTCRPNAAALLAIRKQLLFVRNFPFKKRASSEAFFLAHSLLTQFWNEIAFHPSFVIGRVTVGNLGTCIKNRVCSPIPCCVRLSSAPAFTSCEFN